MEGAAVPAAIVQQQPGEPDAKRAKHSATVREGAAQRRTAGLRHYAVVEHPWLSCSADYQLNLADSDKQHRPGVKYVTADGGARQGGDEDVLWHCGDCHARYLADVAEGNKLPTAPDAFTKAGRNHHAMRDKSVITKHARDNYHTETVKLKAQFAELAAAAGEGPESR